MLTQTHNLTSAIQEDIKQITPWTLHEHSALICKSNSLNLQLGGRQVQISYLIISRELLKLEHRRSLFTLTYTSAQMDCPYLPFPKWESLKFYKTEAHELKDCAHITELWMAIMISSKSLPSSNTVSSTYNCKVPKRQM